MQPSASQKSHHHLEHVTGLILGVTLMAVVLLAGCNSRQQPAGQDLMASAQVRALSGQNPEDLLIVDCLLPGKIRKRGRHLVFQSPGKWVRTAAADCEIRGGEYVAYDRADYATALKFLLPQANNDDVKAQTYVGQIYEKGLGTQPDYGLAAQWYRKAAEKGYARAQISLGNLYEQGLGVGQDKTAALEWYRKAAGFSSDIAFEATPAPTGAGDSQAQAKLRQEVNTLREQLNAAQEKLEQSARQQDEAGQLRQIIRSLQSQINSLQAEATKSGRAQIPKLASMEAGRYYGLIIGNDRYDPAHYAVLKTPANDARQLRKILVAKYGFDDEFTKILINADHEQIFRELAVFQRKLRPNDKFLLYYAGHGQFDDINSRGHWLPVDASKQSRSKWILNDQITDILNLMNARHILVIADSCYSGTMTDLAILHPRVGMPEGVLRDLMEKLVQKPSRTVLTSGALTPVFDAGGGENSVFAQALLNVLEDNEGVMVGKDLFDEVFPRVSTKTTQLFGETQEPVYGALHYAGHQAGDFFFVPTRLQAQAQRDQGLKNAAASGRAVSKNDPLKVAIRTSAINSLLPERF